MNVEQKISGVIKREPVTRSFIGMRDALFDMWDAIRDKTIDIREAEVATKVAAGICKTVEIEIKVLKMQSPSSIREAITTSEPKGFSLGTPGK